MKRTLFGILSFIFLFSFLALNSFGNFANSQSSIFTNVLRLHIIASGNSQKEQDLKLKVRDSVLEKTQVLFDNCESIDEALNIAKENSDLLLDVAKKAANDNGYSGRVKIDISKEYYPEKTYANLTFPKGEYLSVKIILGAGLGKNWWCVLFPPLSGAGIYDTDKMLSDYGFDKKEIENLKTNKTKSINIAGTRVSLKLLEFFS